MENDNIFMQNDNLCIIVLIVFYKMIKYIYKYLLCLYS